jgi:hypothetical protein
VQGQALSSALSGDRGGDKSILLGLTATARRLPFLPHWITALEDPLTVIGGPLMGLKAIRGGLNKSADSV